VPECRCDEVEFSDRIQPCHALSDRRVAGRFGFSRKQASILLQNPSETNRATEVIVGGFIYRF
jgi:hypothetical protein